MHNEPSVAIRIVRNVFRLIALPLSWPLAAVRGRRILMAERSQSAEHAKFNTRKWTPELLKHLEWRRFEETCAAYFEAAGFATRVTPTASGSGVADIGLCAAGSDAVTTLAHCKAWDAYRVGIKPMRELRAAMTSAKLDKGMLVTAGRFTSEATTFAAAEKIELVDGAELLARLAALPTDTALALLKFATQGDFLTPTCPGCCIKMTARRSTANGRKFWGCANYPRCKETSFATAPA
jgi:restriction system protein